MTDTQYADANGIRIAYETFGSPSDPAILLVMGLGTQMIAWPDDFCAELAGAGHYVVRFDNRDVGLSTHLEGVRAPNVAAVAARRKKPPYTLDDMAADAIGLMDALGLEKVHLVGASMGGFIAQTVALTHPSRLHSLTLIMTSTGARTVGRPRPTLVRNLIRRRAVTDREAAIEAGIAVFSLIGSPAYPTDEEYKRDLIERSIDRGIDPGGYFRQLAAVIAQPNRTKKLRSLEVPTLIIHGLDDPLVMVSGGLALARAIKRSKFVGYPGMAHDLPPDLWSPLAGDILEHVKRAASLPASR